MKKVSKNGCNRCCMTKCIELTDKTYNKLKQLGGKKDTYNDIVEELLLYYEQDRYVDRMIIK